MEGRVELFTKDNKVYCKKLYGKIKDVNETL